MTCWPEGGPGLEPGTDMFGIAGTVELGTICPGTGTWNRLQDGTSRQPGHHHKAHHPHIHRSKAPRVMYHDPCRWPANNRGTTDPIKSTWERSSRTNAACNQNCGNRNRLSSTAHNKRSNAPLGFGMPGGRGTSTTAAASSDKRASRCSWRMAGICLAQPANARHI